MTRTSAPWVAATLAASALLGAPARANPPPLRVDYQAADECPGEDVFVDAFDAGIPNGDAINPELNLIVTLNPDPTGISTAVLTCVQLTYDCPFIQ